MEAGRYAVFIGNACPWCHRVLLALIVRHLLPSVHVVHMTDDPERASRGVRPGPIRSRHPTPDHAMRAAHTQFSHNLESRLDTLQAIAMRHKPLIGAVSSQGGGCSRGRIPSLVVTTSGECSSIPEFATDRAIC